MGCNASKAVIPIAEGSTEMSETVEDASTKSSETFTVPVPPFENNSDDNIMISARTSNGLAFEVPISEEDNVIKKHPPKRLQRLEDQQMPCLTHRLLDEKQAEAEQRRLQILNQRIRSAKSRQKIKRTFINNGEMLHHYKFVVAFEDYLDNLIIKLIIKYQDNLQAQPQIYNGVASTTIKNKFFKIIRYFINYNQSNGLLIESMHQEPSTVAL